MLKEYSISDILALSARHIPCYAGTFEGTEDPEIEWPHRHSFFSLVWFREGSGFYVIDFEEYEIKPDRIFLVSPKQIHNWDYAENSKGYILTVDNSLGAELNLDFSFPYIDIDDKTEELLSVVFPDLTDNFQKNVDIRTDIRYICQQIERCAKQNQAKFYTTNPDIIRFRKLVSENHSHWHTVEWYANELRLSPDELNALCKEHNGATAKQYLLDIQLTEAKRLLLYSNSNVNEIAFQLGFEDSSYFSRIFKKKTSFSPSDFLKKYRKRG
ncbi:AraC family transcriptional regulator [uncultured Dysgonomonas sp.]|uniref:helix-turn-helix domain-containing protein n=1 Tax=uncultured Dysgonomonas sp. TaxID=206096 RepID=UPI0028045C3F|nr:AraC family transcriptional regulator [uncultured Dysgonomonas sp.]